MLMITEAFGIALEEVTCTAVRAQGAGGQNVNKLATAIHLNFDIAASSLPNDVKERLLKRREQRLSKDGVIIIKAQIHRTQSQNRKDALQRLRALILDFWQPPKKRLPTKPSRAAKTRRIMAKQQRGELKQTRGKLWDF